jgi:hypothetical protein
MSDLSENPMAIAQSAEREGRLLELAEIEAGEKGKDIKKRSLLGWAFRISQRPFSLDSSCLQ